MPSSIMEHTLESLLTDKDLRYEFIFYVNKIHAQESLLFWMEVEMFKRIVDSDECRKQAKFLYYKYIHTSARTQINVSAKEREQLEETMRTGIWDQTLYDAIQTSIHECLKFSVVRDFCHYMSTRKKPEEGDPESAAFVLAERYIQKAEKDKDFGTLRAKGPNFAFWIKKKSTLSIRPKDKKGSFLGGSRYAKVRPGINTIDTSVGIEETAATEEAPPAPGLETLMRRERLTQQKLQEQIQLLNALHQHQQASFKESGNQFNTFEFPTNNSTNLAKSVSLPSIVRGLSMANFARAKS